MGGRRSDFESASRGAGLSVRCVCVGRNYVQIHKDCRVRAFRLKMQNCRGTFREAVERQVHWAQSESQMTVRGSADEEELKAMPSRGQVKAMFISL